MINIANILTQITAGAFTGYITNTYAIKMLFNEYTVFKKIKIGGVIIRTKDDFIEKISELVERDIINYKTLGQELYKEEFTDSIQNFVRDFFTVALAERLEGKEIKDLQYGSETLEETKEFIKKIIEKNIDEASEIVFKNLSVNDFASSEQLTIILNNLITISLKRIRETQSVSAFISAFIRENGHLTLEELFQSSEKILKNEVEIICQKTPQLIKEIIEIIDKYEIFKNLQDKLNKKKINEIILLNSEEKVLEKLKENINTYVNSPGGNFLIFNLSQEIIKILKNTDKSIMDLINQDFMKGAEEQFEELLNFFVAKIALWIKENSKDIEGLIQEAVNETVESVEGMRGMFLRMIKETILADVAAKNKLAEKIVDFTKDKIDLKSASIGISKEIIVFLKRKKIKYLVGSLEKMGYFSPEIVGEQLKKALIFLVASANPELDNLFFQKRLEEIYPLDLLKIINSKEVQEVLVQELSLSLNSKVSEKLKIPLKDIIKEESILAYATKIEELLEEKVFDFNNQENLSLNIKDESIFKIPLRGEKILFSSLDDYFKEIQHRDLGYYLEKFNNIPKIHEQISDKILEGMHNNLPQILTGKIKILVSENLNKLTPEEVNDVVHDFMGRELEPITKFGGILGGLAGLALALTGGGTSITTFEINPFSLLIYGAVGVLTNVIALEMIFRPYEEKKFLNKIGLSQISQGYIMKNKEAFGKNMGKFVDESLLERGMINSRFEDLKEELAFNIKREVSKEEFILIEKFIKKSHLQIETSLSENILTMIFKNKNDISNVLSDKISKIEIGSLLGQDSQVFTSFLAEKITKEYRELLLSETEINKYISPEIFQYVKINIEENIKTYLKNISESTFAEGSYLKSILLMKENEEKFQQFTKKPISLWLSSNIKEAIIIKIQESISENLFSTESITKISSIVKKKVEEPISSHYTVGNIFNGKIKDYIEDNFPSIMEKLESFILDIIVKNQNEITRELQKNIYENLDLIQKGGYSLMGGDGITAEIIERIVSVKLPPFLRRSKEDIEINLTNTLEEKLYTIRIQDIQFVLMERELNIFLEDLLSSKETKNNILDIVYVTNTEIIERIIESSLESYLKVIDLNSLENFYTIFKEELKIFEEDLLKEIGFRKHNISQKVSEHLLKILEGLSSRISIKDLLGDNLYFNDILEEGTETGKVFYNLLKSIYQEDIQTESMKNIFSKDIFSKDLAKSLELLSNNIEIKEYLHKLVDLILKDFETNRLSFILPETKIDILEKVVFSGLDSLGKNIPDILQAVDFKRITEEEINKMQGKEIHNLFKSFAGKYFTQLKLWGVIGAGFGIHGGVSLLATISYLMKRGRTYE